MTNGDKIRSMTDEELAFFLISEDANACTHCEFDTALFGCQLNNPCVKELAVAEMQDWLASPFIAPEVGGCDGNGKQEE